MEGNLRIVKFGDLLEITENDFFIIRNNFRGSGIFYRIDIFINHVIKVFPEFFFRFDKFTDNGPSKRKIRTILQKQIIIE